MNEIIEYLEEEQESMGSDIHSYIQMYLGYLILTKFHKEYILFSELSLAINTPYVVESKEETSSEKTIYLVKPDLSIFRRSEYKPDFKHEKTKVKQMPLCAIEILSPTQSMNELVNKADCYFANGVLSCWIIIPITKTIFVYNKSLDNQRIYSNQDILTDEVLGIELSIAELFE